MGKRNKTSFILVKISSIIYLLLFTTSTISMFFLFSSEYYNSIIGIFSFRAIFDSSGILGFDESAPFILFIIMLLTVIGLIVTNILMIFNHWVVFFPVLIFSLDIIYQFFKFNALNNQIVYIAGIIAEIFGIILMISYFIMARKSKITHKEYC